MSPDKLGFSNNQGEKSLYLNNQYYLLTYIFKMGKLGALITVMQGPQLMATPSWYMLLWPVRQKKENLACKPLLCPFHWPKKIQILEFKRIWKSHPGGALNVVSKHTTACIQQMFTMGYGDTSYSREKLVQTAGPWQTVLMCCAFYSHSHCPSRGALWPTCGWKSAECLGKLSLFWYWCCPISFLLFPVSTAEVRTAKEISEIFALMMLSIWTNTSTCQLADFSCEKKNRFIFV